MDSALIDTERAVMSTFDFLAGENVGEDDDDSLRYVTLMVQVEIFLQCVSLFPSILLYSTVCS